MAILIRGKRLAIPVDPGEPPPGGTWIAAQKGNASGSIDEDSATQLTFNARGQNDLGNIDYAYQEVESGDIQVVALITSAWSGEVEAFTGFGVGITEGTADSDYFAQVWVTQSGRLGFKRGTPSSNTEQTGPTLDLPLYVGLTYDHSEGIIAGWYSEDGTDWFQFGDDETKTFTYANPVLPYVFGTSHDEFEPVNATLTNCAVSATITIEEAEEPEVVPRNLQWFVDFETGQLQDWRTGDQDSVTCYQLQNSGTLGIIDITRANPAVITYSGTGNPSNNEGMTVSAAGGMTQINGLMVRAKNINTVAKTFDCYTDNSPLGNGNGDITPGSFTFDSSGFSAHASGGTLLRWGPHSTNINGGAGPVSGLPCRVVQSGTVSIGADADVAARVGDFFFKSNISYHRPYNVHQSNDNVNKNKPRFQLDPRLTSVVIDWDEEFWVGFSLYVPSDVKVDTGGSDHRWSNMIYNLVGATASRTHLTIIQDRISTTPAYRIRIQINNDSISEGDFEDEIAHPMAVGAWNDIIVRYRANPFSNTTNASEAASGGQDKVFAGNTGICQIWIGEAGETMTRVVNVVNAPMGLVPSAGQLKPNFRQYKYGWHHDDTTYTTDIEYGWDEIRVGKTIANGTGFSDVHPDQLTEAQAT